MIQRRLYVGQLGDGEIQDVIPQFIKEANEIGEEVFLRWNGITIQIRPEDKVDSLVCEYTEKLRAIGLLQQEREKKLIHIDDLSRKIEKAIRNFIG